MSFVIDLKEGCPIDLLGDRDADSFREWMQSHEHVEVVSRDRSTDYSSAIAALDRTVTEVADKFHLVKNIYDRFSKLIQANYHIQETGNSQTDGNKRLQNGHMDEWTNGRFDVFYMITE